MAGKKEDEMNQNSKQLQRQKNEEQSRKKEQKSVK